MTDNEKGNLIGMDETLIERFRLGDEKALDMLINKNKQLVKHVAKDFYMVGADKEDILQEGMIGLFKAIRDYKPERGNFYSFAKLVISRQIYSAIKASNRQKHLPLNNSISTDELLFQDGEAILPSPESLLLDRESKEAIQKGLEGLLSRLELRVLSLYIEGRSYTQISKLIERDRKTIDNALQRVRKKAEKLYIQ